jgi:hypothetical protein
VGTRGGDPRSGCEGHRRGIRAVRSPRVRTPMALPGDGMTPETRRPGGSSEPPGAADAGNLIRPWIRPNVSDAARGER